MDDLLAIKCPRCGGTGHIMLPKHLRRTLQFIVKDTTAQEVRVNLFSVYNEAVTQQTLSNRLALLKTLGLITREQDGKSWKYTRNL